MDNSNNWGLISLNPHPYLLQNGPLLGPFLALYVPKYMAIRCLYVLFILIFISWGSYKKKLIKSTSFFGVAKIKGVRLGYVTPLKTKKTGPNWTGLNA